MNGVHDPNFDTVEIYCRTRLDADELVIRDLLLERTTSHLPGGDDLGAGLVGNLHSLANFIPMPCRNQDDVGLVDLFEPVRIREEPIPEKVKSRKSRRRD